MSFVSAVATGMVLGVIAARAGEGPPPLEYDSYFTGEALRVDLFHSAGSDGERFGIDELTIEPLWPGTRVNLIDPTGRGRYRFRVLDQATDREIFTQGYCSLLGEWLSTSEALGGAYRTMSEPIRFPLPRAPVTLVLEVRASTGQGFEEIDRINVNPQEYNLKREQPTDFEVVPLHDCRKEPAHTVDMVIVPDGYTTGERYKMLDDARRFTTALLETPPFDRHRDEISVRLILAFSRESGTDEPRKGVFRDTVLDTTFDTFGSPRYLTTSNSKRLRQVAALAPYDTILVMVNTSRYGGGGIFGAYSAFASDSEYDELVMIHEFGHGFGGLADEYHGSSTGYEEDAFYAEGQEPWEPNITIQTEPDKIKWKAMLTPGVPIPTPDTEEYDDVVGLFEGGGYKAKGIFRPTRDSRMFHKGQSPFGPVCEAALVEMIRYLTDTEAAE